MTTTLNNKKVAILLTNGFEQVEMTEPRQALLDVGAQVHLVSPEESTVQGWNHYDKADQFPVDVKLASANASDYDALVLPGGTVNPDQLRVNDAAVAFVKAFFDANKPVAAICHGPWTLVEAGAIKGRKVTSWPSLQTDLKNAGGDWVDQEVVVDNGLITSRNPDDIPAFNQRLIEAIAQGALQTA
ncbi:MAG: type 1 glutamine amidotransferase domain-containing protein [Elainellaceae cyanobacterium]